MEGNWNEGPRPPETPATKCGDFLYHRLRNELPALLGVQRLNAQIISKDRKTVRINFYALDGSQLSVSDWKRVQEYARTVYTEIVIPPDDDEPIIDTLEISFLDIDPNFDNNRTIIISTKE